MPSRAETVRHAVNLMKNAFYPSGEITPSEAWLGFYQVLLWYEKVNYNNYDALPHIIDADKLRPPPSRIAQGKRWASPWQARADRIERYLADRFGCPPKEVENRVDLLLKSPEFLGLQRQNPLGTAFPGLVKYTLEEFGDTGLEYELEAKAKEVYPGIRLPGRSVKPSIDILTTRNKIPCAILSMKWGLRHDRISDITNECPIYKGAALRNRFPFYFYLITNEFDPARLSKVLDDPCIDGVIHVHKKAVVEICKLDGRLEDLIDLSDFFLETYKW